MTCAVTLLKHFPHRAILYIYRFQLKQDYYILLKNRVVELSGK